MKTNRKLKAVLVSLSLSIGLALEARGAGNVVVGNTPSYPSIIVPGSTSGYTTIKAPATVSNGTLFQLPGNNGTNGQAAITDGSGHITWGGVGSVTNITGVNGINVTGTSAVPILTLGPTIGSTTPLTGIYAQMTINGSSTSLRPLTILGPSGLSVDAVNIKITGRLAGSPALQITNTGTLNTNGQYNCNGLLVISGNGIASYGNIDPGVGSGDVALGAAFPWANLILAPASTSKVPLTITLPSGGIADGLEINSFGNTGGNLFKFYPSGRLDVGGNLYSTGSAGITATSGPVTAWNGNETLGSAGDNDIHLNVANTAINWTTGGFSSRLVVTAPTAARTITLPDANSNTVVPSTAGAHQFATAISSAGVITWTQPAFTDISGTATAAQIPTTLNTTTESSLTTVGTITSGGLGSGATIASGIITSSNLPATDTALTTAANLTTVGALASGSIAVGFTAIPLARLSGVAASGANADITSANSMTSASSLVTIGTVTSGSLGTGATIGSGVTGVTQSAQDGSTKLATTAYVDGLTKTGTITSGGLGTGATIGSGVTGVTQSANDNSTKIATTAYVDGKTVTTNTTTAGNVTTAVPQQLISPNALLPVLPMNTSYATITVGPEYATTTSGITLRYSCLGPDGNVWVTELGNAKIAKLSPAGVCLAEYATTTSSSNPTGICAGPDGNIWVAEATSNKIAKFTTAGTCTEYTTTTASSHPHGICTGPDGNIWVTENNSAQIAKFNTSGTCLAEYATTTGSSVPEGICTGPDGNIWVAETSSNIIAKFTTAGVCTEYTTTTGSSKPFGVCSGSDGNIWVTENAAGSTKIAKFTTAGTCTEYATTTANSQPLGICSGPDGNIWVVENNQSQIAKFTTGGTCTEYATTTGSAGVYGDCVGPDGNIWFVEGSFGVTKMGTIQLQKTLGTVATSTTFGGQAPVLFGGNGSDGAVSLAGNSVTTRNYNATTLTVASGTAYCPSCMLNSSGVTTVGGGITLSADSTYTTYAGGLAETNASSAGANGTGPLPGQGGSTGGVTNGAGGGAGSGGSGGNGGGSTTLVGMGGQFAAGGATMGPRDGSGGGAGGTGASGSGGAGGGGGDHLTLIAAGGISGTGTYNASGGAGGAGTTLANGGGGGGGGSIEIYCGTGNMPACTINVTGGAGGASAGVAANSGGGGGGFSYCQSAGTTSSATFTVTKGAAGTGGSGAAAATANNGLSVTVPSKAPTLPAITFNHMNNNMAIKTLAWIELAKRGLRGEEVESEKSHHLSWNGETQPQPFEFLSAYYCKKGSYADLYFALRNGGDDSSAQFCNAENREELLDTFHNKVLLRDWHYPVNMERAAVGDYVKSQPVA